MPRRPPTLRTRPPSRRSTTRHGSLYRKAAWTKASKAFRDSPEGCLCVDCKALGKIVRSEVTDHIVPHNGDLALFWDRSNWAGRCWSHHSEKSRADQTGNPRRIKGGCDPSGMPVDPGHPWRQSR
jgi:5-methylcytosine-specific restriction enzyme A